MEVERLDQLKAGRMKEIAFKKQTELEEIFVRAHIEIDSEAAHGKIMSLIDSGNVEPSELLADMDNQIIKAKEESLSRKEILDKVEKWMSACEEESWLEDYNRVFPFSFPLCVCVWYGLILLINENCSIFYLPYLSPFTVLTLRHPLPSTRLRIAETKIKSLYYVTDNSEKAKTYKSTLYD